MSGTKSKHILQNPPSKHRKSLVELTIVEQEWWELWKELRKCTIDNDPNLIFVNQSMGW